jgi:hypothetical protein
MLMYSIISSIIISFSKKERIYQISIKRREIKNVKLDKYCPKMKSLYNLENLEYIKSFENGAIFV